MEGIMSAFFFLAGFPTGQPAPGVQRHAFQSRPHYQPGKVCRSCQRPHVHPAGHWGMEGVPKAWLSVCCWRQQGSAES